MSFLGIGPVSQSDESKTVVSDFSMVLDRAFNPNEDRSLRVPFYMTSTYRQSLGVPGVSMLVNPSSVSFRQPKRITKQQTQAGTIFYHWSDQDGRNNDILELEFSGQTGNINIRNGTIKKGFIGAISDQISQKTGGPGPIGWLNQVADSNSSVDSSSLGVVLQGDSYTASGASKLSNFLNLYSLTREPTIHPRLKTPVYYYISYSSPVFGNTFVTFIGHFSRVLEFTDDANNPFSANYSMGFTVLSSIPSMDRIFSTVSNNLSAIFTNPIATKGV